MTVVELVWKSVRREMAVAGRWPPWRGLGWGGVGRGRTAEELDVGVWQEMQRDRVVWERLRELAGEEEEEVDDDEDEVGDDGGKKGWMSRIRWRRKTSTDEG